MNPLVMVVTVVVVKTVARSFPRRVSSPVVMIV